MGGCVDAARQARDNDEPRLSQLLGEAARDPLTARRRDPGAHHGDGFAREQGDVAPSPQNRRRRIDGGEHRRIGGVAEHQKPGSGAVAGRQLLFDLLDWRQAVAVAAAFLDQVGQGVQCAPGAAEPVQKLPEGNRADSLCSREAQAGEALGFREAHVFAAPIRGSVPFSRRPMFSLCRM